VIPLRVLAITEDWHEEATLPEPLRRSNRLGLRGSGLAVVAGGGSRSSFGMNINGMVRRSRVLAFGALPLLIAVAALLAWPDHAPHVRRYVCRPLPRGVGEVSFTSNDKFGASIEWSAHLAFNAPKGAMQEIIRASDFSTSSLEFVTSTPGRPLHWPSPKQLGSDSQAFFRVHKPRSTLSWLPRIGTNRRWSEVLLVDGTGTNAFFTMWDTD
jgi:hypothetical protein